ncbi:MAG TPA: adenylate/guanylate cyclase domain-containing protein [Bradyrhizobium sp.]|nr:adenylate/guanylate cyclase domain-containing protein [Bradyrhizobium sp.]
MDVGTWLSGLGLSQYEAVFRESEIDVDVLTELTDQHLKDLGVALGHRLRMLRAIRELAGDAPVKASAAKPQDAADRRQLTVMFCDLVDSTALTARLDPEDMGDLLRAFQHAVAAAVTRFDGHVAKWTGDGASVYFGYPRAHEDDAERATRASIALVEAVGKLRRERGIALEVRIGISTGLVVVGELIGEGEARERGVVGDTPNLASRLQALAEPDTVVVSESTRRLLGRNFELQPLGPQELKGFKSPVPAWSVLRVSENVNRFEASRSEAMTPFVGREQEIALLINRWRRATKGEGQVALLSGEAGIGKSRILAVLRERIGDERYLAFRYQCSPHHGNDAFYPVIGQIWRGAGLVSGEPAAARLDKLETMILSAGLDIGEFVPYLASLLAIPTEGRYPALEMSPSEVKERTIAALIAMVVGIAKSVPVVMLLEDAHWIDPTSLDLTGRLVERVQNLAVLIVLTARPEFDAPWIGRPNFTALALNRFERSQIVTMIDRIMSSRALPTEVLDQIIAKTDGVPLFVEELTKSVLESGLLREENGAYVLAAALTPLAIPSTLHDSLTARLDRLSPIKEIAQIGATIGREFSYDLLEAVSPVRGQALHNALQQLMETELIYGRGTPPKASYIFKHALVQDTAYVSLLRGRRQRIHADIAQVLKERSAGEECPPAIIAHHFTEAGLAEQAAPYWLAAAELALSQSAPVEAEHHAGAGLALIPRVTDGPERDALELGLLVARANAMIPLKSISAPETFAALADAKQLLDRGVGTDLQRVSILYGLCSASTLTARLEQALDFAHQIIEVAERQDDPTYRVVGYRQLGTLQFYAGKNREALQSLQKGHQYCDPRRQRALGYRFSWDQGVALLSFEVLVRLSLGLLDSAAQLSERMRIELLSHGHATTVASATFCSQTWPKLVLGDLEALERESAELAAYCAEKRVEQIRLLASYHYAYACAMRDPVERNIALLRAALDALRGSGGNAGNSIFKCNLAEALLTAGDLAGAEAVLEEGFAFVEQSGERYWLADLHRLCGHVALKRPEPDRLRAEACFKKAIEVARSQEARLLELRAAVDLAQLWRDTGSDSDPRAMLEPILAAIEGGETTRDVRNARAALAGLV